MVTQLRKNQLKQYRDRLHILLDIAQTINQDHTTDELLAEFEIVLREELEVGKIMVFTLTDGEWKNILTTGLTPEEAADIDVERDLTKYTSLTNITLDKPERLKSFDAVIPLFHRFKGIGYVLIGDIDDEQPGISPIIKHLNLIQIIANLIIVFIENKRMQNALLEQEALKREMQLAARIQNQLIPGQKDLPKLNNLKILTFYQPHYGIGGDYYDIIRLSRHRIGFCIADVSGKGVGAAMLMSNFQAIIRSLFTSSVNLKKLVRQLNLRVNESANNEKFITMFIGRYNLLTRKLTYVNAGHLPPLLFDGKRKQIFNLDKGCIGLGMLDIIPHIESGSLKICRHSKLLAFTDGLVELEQNNIVESNTLLLEKIISRPQPLENDLADIKEKVVELVKTGAVFDDIALVGMEFLH